jgi:hypothetical protein
MVLKQTNQVIHPLTCPTHGRDEYVHGKLALKMSCKICNTTNMQYEQTGAMPVQKNLQLFSSQQLLR